MARKQLVAWLLLALLAIAQAEQRAQLAEAHNRYHFGPHAKHSSLKPSDFRRMAMEDIDRLQADLLSLFGNNRFEENPVDGASAPVGISGSGSLNIGPASVGTGRNSLNIGPAGVSDSGSISGSGSSSDPLVRAPVPVRTREEIGPIFVAVPSAVRARWLQMRQALREYYTTVHDSLTLDSRFTVFSSSSNSKLVSVLKSLVQLDVASMFQDRMVSVGKDLRAGKLNTAQSAIDSCTEANKLFTAVYEASSTAKGLINTLTGGLGEGIGDITLAVSRVSDEVIETMLFETAQAEVSVIDALVHSDDDDDIKPAVLPETLAVDITNATVSVAIDITYSILTLGIGPLIGFVADRIVKSVEIGWQRDKEIASCMLGAFGAMSEGLGVMSSVGAQGVQYRVKSEADLVINAGKFTDLLERALAEYKKNPSSATSGIISSEDVYAILNEDFKVVSKFKNVADILSGPASGVSSTIRQYANGNEYEKAAKFAGVSLVSFTTNTFWREFFLTVTNGEVPLANAGFFNNLVVTGNVAYKPLYERFGHKHDYGVDGEYQGSYGCDTNSQCWVYCGADWKGGEWCYSQDPYSTAKSRQKCRTKQDCYNEISPIWGAFKDIPCASTCVLIWQVGG